MRCKPVRRGRAEQHDPTPARGVKRGDDVLLGHLDAWGKPRRVWMVVTLSLVAKFNCNAFRVAYRFCVQRVARTSTEIGATSLLPGFEQTGMAALLGWRRASQNAFHQL